MSHTREHYRASPPTAIDLASEIADTIFPHVIDRPMRNELATLLFRFAEEIKSDKTEASEVATPDNPDDGWSVATRRKPMPRGGSIYRHYKGGLYKVLMVVRRESDSQSMVVYAGGIGSTPWVRPLREFDEKFEYERDDA